MDEQRRIKLIKALGIALKHKNVTLIRSLEAELRQLDVSEGGLGGLPPSSLVSDPGAP